MFRQLRRQVCDLRDVYCLKRSEDLVEKIVEKLTQIVHSNSKMLSL